MTTPNNDYWNEFCDRLKALAQHIDHPQVPQDSLTRAEGYRHLTRLLRAGLDSCVEGSDPAHPVFYSLSNDTIKIGNDNPDNYYLNCSISSEFDYLLEGEMGEVPFFSIASKAGNYATSGEMLPGNEINSDQLEIDDNGHFAVWLSRNQPAAGNWLLLTEHSDNLIIRQYCNARQQRPAQFTIRCLNSGAPRPLSESQFAEKLLQAVRFAEGSSTLFGQWINEFKQHSNQLPANDQQRCIRAGGNASIHYHNSHWQLADDEVLLIKPQRIPECEAWNFQLSNYWMESLDYRYHTISVNNHSAKADADGQITLVVSHKDPGANYPNWLDTAGHHQGSMLFRWIKAREFPVIDTQVLKFATLQEPESTI